MSINKTILLISIFLTNTALSWIDPIITIKLIVGVGSAAGSVVRAVKDVKDMRSDAEADKNDQARLNKEKREIEKKLRECLKENEGKEISKLGVPKVCAKFVKEFILVYGMDEFSKKVVDYEAIRYADK